jgi:hypothetical protein
MTPKNSKAELEKRIGQSGIAALTPMQSVRLMLDFYKEVRADGCELDEDGDMLLFQWGTYDWGQGRIFQFDITRQFIVSEDEDDDAAISQLSLRFHFMPSAQLDAIKGGNRWCSGLDELMDFEAFIVASDAYRAVQALLLSKVTLGYGITG